MPYGKVNKINTGISIPESPQLIILNRWRFCSLEVEEDYHTYRLQICDTFIKEGEEDLQKTYLEL